MGSKIGLLVDIAVYHFLDVPKNISMPSIMSNKTLASKITSTWIYSNMSMFSALSMKIYLVGPNVL